MKKFLVLAIGLFAIAFSNVAFAEAGKCPGFFDRVFAEELWKKRGERIFRFDEMIWESSRRFSEPVKLLNELFTPAAYTFLLKRPQFLPFWKSLVQLDRPDYTWSENTRGNLEISGDYFGLGKFKTVFWGTKGPKGASVMVTTEGPGKDLYLYFRTIQNAVVEEFYTNEPGKIVYILEFSQYQDFFDNQNKIFSPIELVRLKSYKYLRKHLTNFFSGYLDRAPGAFVMMGQKSQWSLFSSGPSFEGLEIWYLVNGTQEVRVGQRVGDGRLSGAELLSSVESALRDAEVLAHKVEWLRNLENEGEFVKLTFLQGSDDQVTSFLKRYLASLSEH